MDNLNYYSAWLPAGQQTDRYSSQPWCLRSKNLDIFSSSKSVKATAWSTPVSEDSTGIVLVDQTWNLILRNDDKVYDRSSWTEVLVYTWVSANFPAYKVSYNWATWTYTDAQWGTPKQLISKYEWDSLKYFTIFTDRARFEYSLVEYKTPYTDEDWTSNDWQYGGSVWKKNSADRTSRIRLSLKNFRWLSKLMLHVQAGNSEWSSQWTLRINNIYFEKPKYWYNAETEQMEFRYYDWTISVPITDQIDVTTSKTAHIEIPAIPDTWEPFLNVRFEVVPPSWSSTYTWTAWYVDIWVWNYSYCYNYLPVNENRSLVAVWEYFWEKATSFQTLYWFEWERTDGDNYERLVRYWLDKYMWWASDVSMDVIWMIVWNEQVYMIGNLEWNWYIIPCDLSWWRWTPYIAYGCTFTGVANIDYLMYLVWDDRGISQLRAYNWQELVKVIWWNKESNTNDLIDIEEQYKFDWKIVKYRWNLILSTSDNRIFEYGQTYGGKGWAFIHEIPWTITNLKADWNDLTVEYSVTSGWTTTKYLTTYQDDTPIKNYNTEWMAEYPIVIWNHLLEKEESDLFVSYILPSADCSLEFWGMANHYHFRTFTSEDDYTFDSELSYKLKWATWDYELKFIEKNGNQYTFRLEWDLPIQTTNDMKITDTEWVELINYSEYNHFRKIWTIETDKYCEWEFRFHNLNNKLELPKSHSLQIMVKGKGNQNYTPELFALDLIANQRERW